jgi:ATP-dependent DNA helicase RecG
MHKFETHNTEFKTIWKDEYLKQVCGFANANGGTLYIGIDDKGEIVGIKNIAKHLEDIPNKTLQYLGIITELNVKASNSLKYLELVTIPSQVPISFKGKYYIRSGTTTQELAGHELRSYILLKDNITWDELTIPKAKIEEIDKHLIHRFTSEAVSQNRLYEDAAKNNVFITLKNLNLVNDKNELSRASILLFSKWPQKHIKTAVVKIGRFGTSDSDLMSQDTIEGNILDMPAKIMEILRIKYLNSHISYKGLKRIEKLEYPEKALRTCSQSIKLRFLTLFRPNFVVHYSLNPAKFVLHA